MKKITLSEIIGTLENWEGDTKSDLLQDWASEAMRQELLFDLLLLRQATMTLKSFRDSPGRAINNNVLF